mmetsp:Transcript_13100/g.20336  ORF Transcript_13100/g.20336 Transcript_13100/m.20336 type:complete len:259 (+) Transcript_13100:488-1264(+)
MLIRAVITIIVTIGIDAFISWKLTLVLVVTVSPISILLRLLGSYVQEVSTAQQKRKAELNQITEEALTNLRTVKAFSTEAFEHEKFLATNHLVFTEGKRYAWAMGGLVGGIQLCFGGCMGVIVIYASWLYEDGEISIGDITAFLLYMIQLMMNFMITTGALGNFYKLLGASEKIIKMMQYEPEINSKGGSKPAQPKEQGELELKDINFHYPTKPDVQVCKSVSIKVKSNQVVALVGKSGCGKSSIIALIERFYNPQSG